MTRQYNNYEDMITFTRASTGTYLDSDGVLKTAAVDVPRIEYDADGNWKGLLIEEARTNYVALSDGSGLGVVRASTSAGTSVWIDGVSTMVKIVENTDTNTHAGYVNPTGTFTDDTVYTFSVYLKADERSWAKLAIKKKNSSIVGAWFDLSNGVLGTIEAGTDSATLEDCGNGIYRCSVSVDIGTGANAQQVFVYTSTADNTLSYTGDGSSGLECYGFQFEAGAFPTSYIPTTGATATRATDDCGSLLFSNFGYNNQEGTFVVEFSYTDPDDSDTNYLISGGASARFFYNNTATSAWSTYDGVSAVTTTDVPQDGTVAKVAIAMSNSGTTTYLNGTIKGSNSSIKPQGNVGADLFIGGTGGVTMINGHIKSIQYYPRRLSNAQLQALTS